MEVMVWVEVMVEVMGGGDEVNVEAMGRGDEWR